MVLNAEKMYMSGKKMVYKELIYHSGYVGHLKRKRFREMVFEKPEVLIRNCVYKMLPKNTKRFERLRKLFIYRDQDHRFDFLPKVRAAQQFGHVKQEDATKYAPELFVPEEELVFELNSEADLKNRRRV